MTVKQLAAALLALPEEVQDWDVITEGCDCFGDAGSLKVDELSETVQIQRACHVVVTEVPYVPSEEEKEAQKKGLLP